MIKTITFITFLGIFAFFISSNSCQRDLSNTQNVKIIEETDPVVKIVEEKDSIAIKKDKKK